MGALSVTAQPAAEHLVVAGKGGVGKSTIAANLSAALAETGKKVLLIGYDSHRNSTVTLRGDNPLRELADWEAEGNRPLYASGYRGSLCLEAGGGSQAEQSQFHPLFSRYRPDYVVHDLAREPAASFELPSAVEGVPRLLVVTTAELGALQAANDLFHWLNTVASSDCRFGGVVLNNLSGPLYQALGTDFLSQAGAAVTAMVAHSVMVSVSGYCKMTLLESAPLSHVSCIYRNLARKLTDAAEVPRPRRLDPASLSNFARKWGEIINELETGVVAGGLGI